jgi:iron complex outermembrane recepter protein
MGCVVLLKCCSATALGDDPLNVEGVAMKLKVMVGGLAVMGLASHALAQTPASAPQRIEITGSAIKRIAAEGALPVQVISRKELEREGITSAEQLVMMLSTNGNGLDNLASNADVVGGAQRGNNGATSANLRGQGASSTLVLLNGRRVAAHGLNGAAVDLNQIPMAAVDRVEVLKDGASALYGTDAIGGVINFILRRDYSGMAVQGFADITQKKGGEIYRGSVVGGFGNLDTDGFNVMGTVAYSDYKALRGDQRSFVNTFQPDRGVSVDTRGTPFATILPLGASTATTINPATPNGTIINSAGVAPFVPGSTTVRASGGINVLDLPGGAGCKSIDGMAPYDDLLWDFPQAQFACAWDTGRAAVLQQPVKSLNYVGRGSLKLGEHLASLELTGSKVDSAKRFSNLQITPNTSTQNYAYPRNSITAPVYDDIARRLVAVFPTLAAATDPNRVGGALPMSYRWRCIECGPREIKTTTDTSRIFAGIEGPVMGYDYKVGVLQATSDSKSQLGGGYYYRNSTTVNGVTQPGIIDALNSGNVNPFLFAGQSQSAAGLAAIEAASARGVTLYSGKFTLEQFDASVSGPIFSLPGGDAMLAAGVDVRKEKYKFNGDDRAATARPIIIAAPFDDGNALLSAKRDVKAMFAEVLLPVIKDLEFTGAVRTDNYSGFGRTTNPKVSLRYRPVESFLLRGSFSKGFRVPTFNQIYNGVSVAAYTGRDLVDPATCPTGRVDSTKPGCEVVTPEIANGGKRDLGPEKAKMSSVGIVFEPFSAFSVGLDWWKIEKTATIQTLSLTQLIDNYGLFTGNFYRDASGKLVGIDNRYVNAGATSTQGIEVSLKGNGMVLDGRWTAGMEGTYLVEKKSRVVASAPWGPSEVGQFSFAGDLGLRWKHTAFVTYALGDWAGSLSQTYRLGYQNQELPGVTSGLVTPPNLQKKVKDYTTYNASLTWSGIKDLGITLGVKNLLDTDPPFAITYDSNFGSGSSWEPRVADPRGRSFTLTVNYKFF